MELNSLNLQNPASLLMDNVVMSKAPAVHNAENFSDIVRRASAGNTAVHTNPVKEPIDKEDKLYQLCLDLETFLVKNLLNGMRNTVQKSGLVEEGFAGKMYEDMLYDEYAKDFTKNASFGLAEQAYRQLKML